MLSVGEMIYVNKNAPQPVITHEKLYKILVVTNVIFYNSSVFVYLGYPYDKINNTMFIPLCIICTKGFIVSCENNERQWCSSYLTQLMTKRHSLFNVYNRASQNVGYINFIDLTQQDSQLIYFLDSLGCCFDFRALRDAHAVFNRVFKI